MRSDSVNCLYSIVEFIELLVTIKCAGEDIDHFEVLFEMIQFVYKQFYAFVHDVLGQNHHYFVFELPANNHVPDGSGNEILIELLLVLLTSEESFEVLLLIGQFYPAVGIQDVRHVLQLIRGRNLIDSIQLALQCFMIKRVLLEAFHDLIFIPLGNKGNILHTDRYK